jgi:hypothetical protein
MFLSNPRKSCLLVIAVVTFFQACGPSQTYEKNPILPRDEATKRSPFPTTQPEIYQCDFVVGNRLNEGRNFVARKMDKWRFDHKIGEDGPATTLLRSDRVYSIDHRKKTYEILSAEGKDFDIAYFNTLTWGFFYGANYLEFEEIERGDGRTKYKAKTYKGTKSDVFVTIDDATGIMVRQELPGKKDESENGSPVDYIYEARNLKLDVDDSVFELPAGYKRAAR